MGIIKVMSDELKNKIAAGEVVESLMNIVKELVENSIDAESSTIKIDLMSSGIKEIKVTDDGKGMNREDAVNCILRHATSKIYKDADLFNINTLGFRGEALPSIAAVSLLTIKTSDDETSTLMVVEGGIIKSIDNTDMAKGTTVKVENIFYNTPARLKYLKSLNTELANITNYVDRMALANPNIKFILTNDGKTILNTSGSGNLLNIIANIYGISVAKKMAYIEKENDDYSISGYISYPEESRSSRNFITLLVNGRSVRNTEINKTILDAYHTYLFHDRYPIIILNIDVDPHIIDVNIHPTKMEIKFSKMAELKELIYDEISSALSKLVLIPEVKYEDKSIKNIDKVTVINKDIDFKKEEVTPTFEEITFDFNVEEEETPYNSTQQEERYKKINPVALIHGTYIIGENEDGIYLIDQHAANERINYEYYKKSLGEPNNNITDLLIPIKLDFTKDDFIKIKENKDIINKININYDEFGSNTIIVRSHPSWIKKEYVTESLRKIFEIVINNNDFSKEKFNEKIAITLACKMAIKANYHIEDVDMKALLDRLSKTSNPYTCPHGRPTIITFTKYELQKMFKRVE